MKTIFALFILIHSYIHADSEMDKNLKAYFFAAARTGDEVVMREFLKAGMPINLSNHKGYSALMIAAYNGNKGMVDLLLTQGANACMEDRRGNTALMGAIFKGEIRIAKRLLSEACNPDHQNKAGQTTAMFASLFGNTALINALKQKGADLTLKDNLGNDIHSLAESQGITLVY